MTIKEELELILKALDEHIAYWDISFYICNDSGFEVSKECFDYLVKVGNENIICFNKEFAFTYGDRLSTNEYNQKKKEHIELAIKLLDYDKD